jgi:hypothetical protein
MSSFSFDDMLLPSQDHRLMTAFTFFSKAVVEVLRCGRTVALFLSSSSCQRIKTKDAKLTQLRREKKDAKSLSTSGP